MGIPYLGLAFSPTISLSSLQVVAGQSMTLAVVRKVSDRGPGPRLL